MKDEGRGTKDEQKAVVYERSSFELRHSFCSSPQTLLEVKGPRILRNRNCHDDHHSHYSNQTAHIQQPEFASEQMNRWLRQQSQIPDRQQDAQLGRAHAEE